MVIINLLSAFIIESSLYISNRIEIIQIKIDNLLYYYFAWMFHGQVICFFTRSFDLVWLDVAPTQQNS